MAQKKNYRVLGTRQCPCGGTVTVTSKDPNQKFCRKYCPAYNANSLSGRLLAAQRLRHRLVLRMLDAAKTERGTLTTSALLEVADMVYQRAYRSGYSVGKREAVRDLEMANIFATHHPDAGVPV
jgi:hypothetical protein